MPSEKSAAESVTIDQLVESFVGRLRAGEQVTIESYQQQYPDLAEEIGQIFPSLQMLETCRPQEEDEPPKLSAVEDVPPNRLGEYRILQEIGRGGMGIVYEAEHDRMRRRVALKVLPKSMAQRSSHLARFQLEARSAGLMHHTNIVPVFEVGEDQGFHFYAMQFIQGQNLDLVIQEMRAMRLFGSDPAQDFDDATIPARADTPQANDTTGNGSLGQTLAYRMVSDFTVQEPPPTPENKAEPTAAGSTSSVFGSSGWALGNRGRSAYIQRVAAIGMQVADALAYAHHSRILHRDIKPANLLLDTDGTVWVTDFGLAKGDDDDLTQTGDIVGTLKYMPPERFAGQTDGRSDIYCLGLTLYELSTLTSAFAGKDRARLVEQVTQSSPRAPRAIDPSIPRDFETIVLKAIDRNPDRRYQTARQMAADLQAFMLDRPIRARRISVPERLWRLCRRNPVTAVLSAISLTLLVTAALGASIFAYQIKLKSEMLKAQNERASSHLALTEQTVDGMLKRLSRELRDLPQTSVVREQLLGEALELQEKMLALEKGDATVALRTVTVHKRMADLHQLLGRHNLAVESAQKAIDLAVSLELEDADKYHFELGRAYAQMAGLLRQKSDWSRAREYARLAVDEFLKVAAPVDGSTALADAYRVLGAIEEQIGNPESAEEALKKSLAILENQDAAIHGAEDRQMILTEVLNSLAILYRSTRRYDESEEHYLRCMNICQRMADEGLHRTEALDQLGVSAINLGNLLLTQSRKEEAETYYQRSAETFAALERDYPRVVRYQERVARSLMSLALVAQRQQAFDKAEESYRGAIEKLEAIDRRFGLTPATLDVLAGSYNNLGNVLADVERFEESLASLEHAIAVRQRISAADQARPIDFHAVNRARANYANVLMKMGNWKRAEELFTEIYADQKSLVIEHPTQQRFAADAVWLFERIADVFQETERFSEIELLAKDVTDLIADDSKALVVVARRLAKAAAAAKAAETLGTEERQATKDQLAHQAIRYLESALDLGWPTDRPFREDESLRPLLEYDEFTALID